MKTLLLVVLLATLFVANGTAMKDTVSGVTVSIEGLDAIHNPAGDYDNAGDDSFGEGRLYEANNISMSIIVDHYKDKDTLAFSKEYHTLKMAKTTIGGKQWFVSRDSYAKYDCSNTYVLFLDSKKVRLTIFVDATVDKLKLIEKNMKVM